MIKIETSVVINHPIEEVFAFVTDVEKMPQWSAELVEAKKTSEGPVGVGTTFSAVAKVLGKRMENDHEVSLSTSRTASSRLSPPQGLYN